MSRRLEEIRARLDHPVVDSDGHHVEFLPEVRDRLLELAGGDVAAAFDTVVDGARLARSLDPELRRQLGLARVPWWGLPARNTLDRATAMLPRLLHERLDELGIDFAILYPTYGLIPVHLPEEELRRAGCRAFNRYSAEAFAEFGERLTPAACIPMHTPEEAVEELHHAVGSLGLRVAMLAGYASRPYLGESLPRGARWLDFFGLDSPHDYDPVWAACEELGVSPTFHSTGMGWGSRSSPSNYVYNHIGNFAAAGEGACRSLFLAGVPWRFPKLRFAFLEGGVHWGRALCADLIGHWQKRNREDVHHYDPANLDRELLASLIGRYAGPGVARRLDRLDESLQLLSDPDEDPAEIDEFARCRIGSPEDIRDIFTERFHFGCEADDRLNLGAFDTRTNPLGARFKAIFSSDIGHWDVPDMRDVLADAFEPVEEGMLSPADFRDFVFGHPLSLWCGGRPDFFAGTALADAARTAA